MNLWKETVAKLEKHGKTVADIKFVQTRKGRIKNFEELAKKIDYDKGYGGQQIEPSLVIVGDDWWLERAEYDGAEWFEFKKQPIALDFVEHTTTDIS